MSKRMSKGEFQQTLGALNPVGHTVMAFADGDKANDARQAVFDAGFTDADILQYSSSELFPNLDDLMRNASGGAGFGYEITLMRRYMTLASEGAGWLVVYSPEEAQTARLQQIARDRGALSAVHYGQLLHEDLI